jgi:hypothetical protein
MGSYDFDSNLASWSPRFQQIGIEFSQPPIVKVIILDTTRMTTCQNGVHSCNGLSEISLCTQGAPWMCKHPPNKRRPSYISGMCLTHFVRAHCVFKAWWKVSAYLWVVVKHDKALEQGLHQNSALPLAAALGRCLKVTTYGKALRQGHYQNSALPSTEVGRHLILVMTPSVGLTYHLKQPSTTFWSYLVV